jgi:hypothetical protein
MLLLALFPLACSSSSKAELQVTFTPNPAPYTAPHTWEFRVFIAETKGIGVYLNDLSIKVYSNAGILYGTTVYTSSIFTAAFLPCGGSGTFLGGGQMRCADYSNAENQPPGGQNWGYMIFTISGTDERGNTVRGKGRVNLI